LVLVQITSKTVQKTCEERHDKTEMLMQDVQEEAAPADNKEDVELEEVYNFPASAQQMSLTNSTQDVASAVSQGSELAKGWGSNIEYYENGQVKTEQHGACGVWVKCLTTCCNDCCNGCCKPITLYCITCCDKRYLGAPPCGEMPRNQDEAVEMTTTQTTTRSNQANSGGPQVEEILR
jgi:hypothetical protein